ncbi:hypothetical protein [Desulfatibacillum aliphaticivorans]|uniref:hypothetical protein n=1 Tax=Desulfatibacillum aliphaticivorans TaxID=218208 RepID=UPI0004886544|nr:hypothetical protein [Desulfatibacillum aliphaticivorans]
MRNPGERRFSSNEVRFLVAATVLGSIIRIVYHCDRPFMNDEIGTLIYIEKSIPFLLTHFESWLTMNYFILMEKGMFFLGGGARFSLIAIPLLAGIATIPLTALFARMMVENRVALLAAALASCNPFLIHYSGIIRSYPILAALSLIALILYFKWSEDRSFKNGIFFAIAAFFLFLSHLNGAYTLLFIACIFLGDWVFSVRSGDKRVFTTLLYPCLAFMLLAALSHVKLISPIYSWSKAWTDAPPASIDYIPYVFSQYFGRGYGVLAPAGLFIAALFLCVKRNTPLVLMFPYLALPVLAMSLEGLSHYPWAYARFLFYLIPVGLIIISQGVDFIAFSFPGKTRLVFGALTGILIITWALGITGLFFRKENFKFQDVAVLIKSVYEKNDFFVYNNWSLWHNCEPYFRNSEYSRSTLEDQLKSDEKSSPGKMFFVTSEPFLNSPHETHQFGELQVVIYPNDGRREQLLALRDDLKNSVHFGDVSAELANYYRHIWMLNKKLQLESGDNFDYYQMAVWCEKLSKKELNMPKNVQLNKAGKKARHLASSRQSSPDS